MRFRKPPSKVFYRVESCIEPLYSTQLFDNLKYSKIVSEALNAEPHNDGQCNLLLCVLNIICCVVDTDKNILLSILLPTYHL